jgi:ribonuclease R
MTITQGITIDGATSKDLDDAIWIERKDCGFVIMVLVSNVSDSIAINSDSDIKAKNCQFSIYRGTGGCVKPMLPRSLSEDKLSLLPGEKRGVLKFEFDLDTDLKCTDMRISEGIFQNLARFTHGEIPEIISNQGHELHKEISLLSQVSEKLLCRRRDAGSMAIYDIVAGWGADEEGNINPLADSERNIGYVIVQEMMILANTLLSTYCVKNDIPILYRNHRPKSSAPDIKELTGEIAEGFKLGDEKYLNHIRGRIALIAGKAEMDVKVKGHFGLNLPAYAYFTSPIRRYPDLVCHRNLLAHVRGEKFPYSLDQLEQLAKDYNTRIDYVRNEKNAFFKSIANIEGQRNLECERYSIMTEADLYRIIKVAQASSQSYPISLQNEICHRVESECLDNKTLALVFATSGTQFEQVIRERIYRSVRKRSYQATVIHQIICQKFEGTPLDLVESFDGPDNSKVFYCKALSSVADRHFFSNQVSARSKKKAAQLATLDLLQSMIGLSFDCSEALLPKIVQENNKDIKLLIDSKNPKSTLLEWCQKMEFPLPEFNTVKSGPDHMPSFISEVTVIKNNRKQVVNGSIGGSKKEAEKLAVLAWVNKYEADN